MPRLGGRFFFKLTDNRNLIGEFSNNLDANISTESADIKESCGDKACANCKFHGTYYSTWRENREPIFAELKITPKTGAANQFTLKWYHEDGGRYFKGEGMLCDGILIGDYQLWSNNDSED